MGGRTIGFADYFGVLAGLTVYAVPQVLAAAAAMGAVVVQMGTLVMLVRVLMLGPVVLGLSLLTRRMRDETDELAPHVTAGDRPKPGKLPLHKLVPWFIVGFLALPLGLGTDLKTVAGVGPRVIAAVTGSLAVLKVISIALIRVLGIA